ncbi:hypothetical protein Btru_023795 [Bulinus truncatus]|nr:hypothetical protein Btru_023795 [Bulinus truncatus]
MHLFRLLGSSKSTENNSSSQCTSTTAAYLEMNNMTKWLDGRGCLMIVQRNTSFDGHFCVPDLVPPYSMSAVLNDEPIVAVTIDGCCHLEVVVDTTLSLLRLQYIEEEGMSIEADTVHINEAGTAHSIEADTVHINEAGTAWRCNVKLIPCTSLNWYGS